jgi:hypothetical protein
MSRPLKLKVTGAVCCRLSNSPITGYRVVCGGAPQTFSPSPAEELCLSRVICPMVGPCRCRIDADLPRLQAGDGGMGLSACKSHVG